MNSNRTARALAFSVNNSNSNYEAPEPNSKRPRIDRNMLLGLPTAPLAAWNNEITPNYFTTFSRRSHAASAPIPAPAPAPIPAPVPEEEEEVPNYVNAGIPVPGTPEHIRRNLESLRVNNVNNSTYEFEKCVKIGNSYHIVGKPHNLAENTIKDLPVIEIHSIEDLIGQPGVYTWLLTIGQYSRADDRFVARRALTPGEIKSKHKNIFRDLRTNQIVLAGEVLVREGPDITFNFMSGTYMPHIKNMHRRGRTNAQLNEYFSNYMIQKFIRAGVPPENIHFNEGVTNADTLITRETTMEALQPYLNAGYALSNQFNNLNSCEAVNPYARGGSRTKKIARRRRRKTRGRH